MGDLVKADIIASYNKVKNRAKKAILEKDYEEGLRLIRIAANIAYNFNFFYKDDQLEDLLLKISSCVVPESENYSFIKGRFVFYDYFGMQNKGLTQQYIRALISWGCEFLYILENNNKWSEGVLSELKDYGKAKVVIIDSNLTLLQKITFAHEEICMYQPEFAFLHLHPASVVAVTVWNRFLNIKRFQINLTDHAFWLGVRCFDYSLEFRNYGASVTIQKRGIPSEKILMQPFYPITECEPFKGLPPITEDKVIIFTGGAYYKMYGDNGVFFGIMKELLDENLNVVILIGGDGDAGPLNQFIIKNNYSKRIFLIGNRPDINFIFQRCDIYLSTYPITGGLMSQLAALSKKPILSYSSADIPSNDVESFLFFGSNGAQKITHHNLSDFFDYSKELIINNTERITVGEILNTRVIDAKSFNELLYRNVFFKQKNPGFVEIYIDYERFENIYLEVENSFLQTYRSLIIHNFKLSTLYLFPKIAFSWRTLLILFKSIKKRILEK